MKDTLSSLFNDKYQSDSYTSSNSSEKLNLEENKHSYNYKPYTNIETPEKKEQRLKSVVHCEDYLISQKTGYKYDPITKEKIF